MKTYIWIITVFIYPRYRAFIVTPEDTTGKFTGHCGEDVDALIHELEERYPGMSIELDQKAKQALKGV